MPPIFHLDYETTSPADIKKVGGYRYANDPGTRILMFAIAQDDRPPMVWRFDQPTVLESVQAKFMLGVAIREGHLIYAHNAPFEVAVTHYRLAEDVGIGDHPSLEQWRCTAAMARRAALPPSLGSLAEVLKVEQQKDAVGKTLIRIFSDQNKEVTLKPPKGLKEKPRKTATPLQDAPILWDWLVRVDGQDLTLREAFELFIAYCRHDVVAEQQVHQKLARFELAGDELASFQFDLRMNHRGVPVNLDALDKAQKLIRQFNRTAETRFKNLCGLLPSQGKALLPWLQSQGYTGENLQADTVETALADTSSMTGTGVEVLRLKALTSFAALKKIDSMKAAACDDGHVRGTMIWHGARTGRDTGTIVQPQNMKKATIPDSRLAYRMICEGDPLEDFETLWGSPMEVVASCARHFIQFPDGREMLDGDFVGVEARITPWLVGAKDTLDSILRGEDQYKLMAARTFNTSYDKVTKLQRTIAKPIVLGCCFGVGGKGLQTALARPPYKIERSLKECKEYVRIYRDANPELVDAWKALEEAARRALRKPGSVHRACHDRVAFTYAKAADIPYLIMRLPSGRRLYYPWPKVKAVFKKYDPEEMEEEPWKREKGGYWIDELSFWGKRQNTAHWGRIATFGSRLLENVVQATGADLLNYGCRQAEAEGYDIFMIVHDQALAPADKPLDGFLEAFCRKQPWAEDFPLEADGNVVPFYLKED